ncbi:hypothetical protein [Bradyrhizobium yuanmingense]|uniref:hypothetical protein n=1 Tax=Bradyrhizobium yuanmingense TaxID=108015 RepID=UPI001CD7287E|nr:hypothetical protein [Bradyrhizobium yuanmingense]MCA1524287.1 hypothetical protein [Bradyrhizobium yuanmingense]
MARFFYDPYDWYWLADDGRLYSSKRQSIVPESDPDFVEWQGDEPKATPQIWPRDDQGNQTDAELQKVMDEYGFTVPSTAKGKEK